MLYEIDYDYDRKLLYRECTDSEGYEPFIDPKTGTPIEKWLIKRDVTGYGRMITEEFEKRLDVSIKPRFYIQETGFTLPYHRDRSTTCAINFILSTSRDPMRRIATCHTCPSVSDRRTFFDFTTLENRTELLRYTQSYPMHAK